MFSNSIHKSSFLKKNIYTVLVSKSKIFEPRHFNKAKIFRNDFTNKNIGITSKKKKLYWILGTIGAVGWFIAMNALTAQATHDYFQLGLEDERIRHEE